MNEVEQYINKIVNQTDCTKEEKADLTEELTAHLELLIEDNRQLGMSETEAIRTAIQSFGCENVIGRELQQAMFPYRRELLIIVSLSFIAMTFASFTLYLIHFQEALYIQMLINVCIGLGLLFITTSSSFHAKRRLVLNSFFILTLLGSTMNSLTLQAISNSTITIFLILCNITILLILIIMLYITTLHSDYKDNSLSSSKKIVHLINITFGLLLLPITLFFIWAFLFTNEANLALLQCFIPLIIWVCLYTIQIRFQKQLGKIVYVFFAIYALFIGTIMYLFRG